MSNVKLNYFFKEQPIYEIQNQHIHLLNIQNLF